MNIMADISNVSISIKANIMKSDCGAILIVVLLFAVTSNAARKDDFVSPWENINIPIAAKANATTAMDAINPNLRMNVIFLLAFLIFSWLGFIFFTPLLLIIYLK